MDDAAQTGLKRPQRKHRDVPARQNGTRAEAETPRTPNNTVNAS